jgi:hypothetical protein
MKDSRPLRRLSGVADLGHDGHLLPQIPADRPNNVTMPQLAIYLPAGPKVL